MLDYEGMFDQRFGRKLTVLYSVQEAYDNAVSVPKGKQVWPAFRLKLNLFNQCVFKKSESKCKETRQLLDSERFVKVNFGTG